MVSVIQSVELVGVMLVWLAVILGIIAFRFNDDRGWFLFAKFMLLAAWIWGTAIPAVFYLM